MFQLIMLGKGSSRMRRSPLCQGCLAVILSIFIVIIIYETWFTHSSNEGKSLTWSERVQKAWKEIGKIHDSNEENNDKTWPWNTVIQDITKATDRNVHCSSLYQDQTIETFFPGEYQERLGHIQDTLSKDFQDELIEGHVGQLREMIMLYWDIAKQPSVKTICEIGFNAGHSTLIWLSANPSAKVLSFDNNIHSYTVPMVEYLMAEFPGRLSMFYGDSLETVAKAVSDGETMCDIAIIDGGHDVDVIEMDLENMKGLCNENSLLVLDDAATGQPYSRNVMTAWAQQYAKRKVDSYFHCAYNENGRGVILGKYVYD